MLVIKTTLQEEQKIKKLAKHQKNIKDLEKATKDVQDAMKDVETDKPTDK